MILFRSKKPPYTPQELSQQVFNLERLNKLRDMCIQKTILQPNDAKWFTELHRYTRNIETGQRLLDHMHEANIRAQKKPLRRGAVE